RRFAPRRSSALSHGQRGGRVGAADQHVDLFFVEPFASAGRGDIGLVLVVGNYEFDLLAIDFATGVLDGQAYRFTTARAVDVGINTGHICDHADPDDVVGDASRLAGKGDRKSTRLNSSHVKI